MKLSGILAISVSLAALTAVSACSNTTPASPDAPSAPETSAQTTMSDYPNSDLVVDTSWLNGHYNDSHLAIIDTRNDSDYNAGHIMNSVNLPPGLFDETSTYSDQDKTALMDADSLAAALGQAGISEKDEVIVYGATVDPQTGRVFWLLEYLGHSDVHILNGGFGKWENDGYAVTKEQTMKDPTTFNPSPKTGVIADKAYVLDNLDKRNVSIVDSRNEADWIVKRIPGSVNILWGDYLNDDGKVKSYSELTSLLDSKGIAPGETIITHCYVGYRSSQAYFIYRLMGYSVSNYDGSSTEWFNDTSLPTEP